MKRILSLLAGFILISLTTSGNIKWENTWRIYHPNKGAYLSGYRTWGDTLINEYSYYHSYFDSIKIRFDGNKAYRYLCDTQEEILTIDMDLQVNDIFTMPDGTEMIVTAVSDTIFYPCYFIEPSKKDTVRKCLYLQSKNDPQHTDIWVEGIGSLNYGIIPIGNGKSQRALYCYAYLFPFTEENIQNTRIEVGENLGHSSYKPYITEYNISLQNGVLHIDGILTHDGFGYKYVFAKEKNDTIQLIVDDTPPLGDGYVKQKFSVQLPGFEKENYTYQIYVIPDSKSYEGTITASVTNINKEEKTLTLHRDGRALMAVFPTASAGEAITLYDATGRAVATQAVRQGATTATIDIAALPAGVYIARLNSGATAKVVL